MRSTLLRVASIKVIGASAALSSPLLSRASLVGLSVWAIAEFGDIAKAIAESRHGAWITIATAAVVLFAALLSSIVGFAFSAIAGSALAYFGLDPVSAVRTIVLCSCAIQLYSVWKLRASIRWRPLWLLLLSGALTVPMGVWLLIRLDASFYVAGLGLFLIGYVVLVRRETHVVRGGNWTGVIAGIRRTCWRTRRIARCKRDDLVLDARMGQTTAARGLPAVHPGHAITHDHLPALASAVPRAAGTRPGLCALCTLRSHGRLCAVSTDEQQAIPRGDQRVAAFLRHRLARPNALK